MAWPDLHCHVRGVARCVCVGGEGVEVRSRAACPVPHAVFSSPLLPRVICCPDVFVILWKGGVLAAWCRPQVGPYTKASDLWFFPVLVPYDIHAETPNPLGGELGERGLWV